MEAWLSPEDSGEKRAALGKDCQAMAVWVNRREGRNPGPWGDCEQCGRRTEAAT